MNSCEIMVDNNGGAGTLGYKVRPDEEFVLHLSSVLANYNQPLLLQLTSCLYVKRTAPAQLF